MRAAGLRRIHVVTGFRRQALASELARLDVVEAYNPDFAAGMFSSVQVGVASLPFDVAAFLLAPVDATVAASTVARILRAAAASDAAVVYPAFRGKRGHPPFVRRSLFAEILAGGGESDNGGLRPLLARHEDSALNVVVLDRGCLMDMDTPTTIVGCRRRWSGAGRTTRCPLLDDCGDHAPRRFGRPIAAVSVVTEQVVARRRGSRTQF